MLREYAFLIYMNCVIASSWNLVLDFTVYVLYIIFLVYFRYKPIFLLLIFMCRECPISFYGPNCSKPCRLPNYGLGCQRMCSCK